MTAVPERDPAMSGQPSAAAPARGKRPKQGEPVIDRALSLLAVFTDRRRALTLSEMARYADMPAPTALRLIARLVAGGVLERLDDGRYVVGGAAVGSRVAVAPCRRGSSGALSPMCAARARP
jgi:hypothetical protein